MLFHGHLLVNAPAPRVEVPVERPYIDPVPGAELAPGEDGTLQSVSNLVFDCCLGLIGVGTLFVLWPLLQSFHVQVVLP